MLPQPPKKKSQLLKNNNKATGNQTFVDEMNSGLEAHARLAQGLLTGHRANESLARNLSQYTAETALSLRCEAESKTPLRSRPVKIIASSCHQARYLGGKLCRQLF